MPSSPMPKPWDILRGEDGLAIVLPEGEHDKVDVMITMLSEDYGGGGPDEPWSRDNPVITDAANELRFDTWFSCSKAWCEEHAEDPDAYMTGYWAGDGDGKRSIKVAWIDRYLYDLGDEAHSWEEAKASGEFDDDDEDAHFRRPGQQQEETSV